MTTGKSRAPAGTGDCSGRNRQDTDAANHTADDAWPTVLARLGVDLREPGCPCGGRLTWHGYRERWECVAPDGTYAQGDALALLQHAHGWTAAQACERVAEVLARG